MKLESSRIVQTATQSAEMAQMGILLKEQRKSIIESLKKDLPVYLNYKFSKVASEVQLNQIRLALIEFDQSPISEHLCITTRQDPARGFNTFYQEINGVIANILDTGTST